MKTSDFISLLKDHRYKELVFEYQNGQFIGANYHITEVKNITIDSVDCGAGTDFWKETVVQLWESPKESGKSNYMTARKALGILNKVGRIKPLDENAVLKFEYGNNSFHTAQLYVTSVASDQERLLVKLSVQPVACKAGETCGVPASEASLEVSNCAPANGCC